MAKPYNQVVLFGDSLLQQSSLPQDGFSFQGALQDYCIRRLDVVNRGFSGYNTKNILDILPEIFPPLSPSSPKIEYLVVLLGANDASIPIPTNTQGVPIEQYKANLTTIITHERIKAHNPKILLVTPPPLDEIRLTQLDLEYGHKEVTRHAAVSATYTEAAREVARAAGVTLIDLYKAVMDLAISKTPDFDANGPPLGHPGGKRGALEVLIPDGLHLNGEAYKAFFDLVKPHIGPFPEGTEGYIYPAWRTVNPGSI